MYIQPQKNPLHDKATTWHLRNEQQPQKYPHPFEKSKDQNFFCKYMNQGLKIQTNS
jgi:hypothetical protein